MNSVEVQLIKNSWKMLRSIDPLIIGDVFYTKLFFDFPQVKSMFKNSKEEQSKKLIGMLNVIVGRLDRLNELAEEIAALAVRHVGYGVKLHHYKAVGAALLWTLQQGLGPDWSSDMALAWEKCFGALADNMIKTAYPEFVENLQNCF